MGVIIPFESLWQRVVHECAPKGLSVHGVDHWRRVERNAIILATQSGASVDVVRLFALFHDCQRVNDGHDPEHGARGAAYARTLLGEAFEMPEAEFARLEEACVGHTDGLHHADPTIGTCWDADRLDLGRVGIVPHARFMSTALGREIAAHGSISPWVHLAPEIWP